MNAPFFFTDDAPNLLPGGLTRIPDDQASSDGPTTLLLDHFTGSNGTSLAAHPMDVGPGWTVTQGSYTIQTNQCAGGSSDNWAHADAGNANVTLTLKGTLNGAGNGHYIAPMLRYSDDNNQFQCIVYGDGNVILYEHNAGTYTQRASGSWTADTSQHTYQLAASGTTLTLTLDGSQVLTYGSASFNQTATGAGIRANGAGSADLIDDFQVTSP